MDQAQNRGEAAAADAAGAGDWRNRLQADTRRKIVNKFLETLKRHFPFSGQEGQQELMRTAVRLEEKCYIDGTKLSDYLQKVAFKALDMETTSENPMANRFVASSTRSPQGPEKEKNNFDWMEKLIDLELKMDEKNWAAQAQALNGGEAAAAASGAMDFGDWRNRLQADTREKVVNKFLETLRRHFPFSGQEGQQELMRTAVRLEEKCYIDGAKLSDYLRMAALKMLAMETTSENPMANPVAASST